MPSIDMNLRDVVERLGFFQGGNDGGLKGRGVFYGLGILLAVAFSWYAYQEHRTSQRRWNQAENFSRNLARYRRLNALRSDRKNQSGSIENPLAYLENQVSQKKLGGLSPLGTENGRPRYRLALEGVSSSFALKLMQTLDDKRGITIDSYSMERVSLDGTAFDARFELSVVQ